MMLAQPILSCSSGADEAWNGGRCDGATPESYAGDQRNIRAHGVRADDPLMPCLAQTLAVMQPFVLLAFVGLTIVIHHHDWIEHVGPRLS